MSSLVDAVLVSLDDTIYSSSKLGFGTLDSKDDLQQATGGTVSADQIHTFQEKVGTPFVVHLKENISRRFSSHDIVSALAIFSPRKVAYAAHLREEVN